MNAVMRENFAGAVGSYEGSKCAICGSFASESSNQALQTKFTEELTDELAEFFKGEIKELGYRQFLSDGTSIGFCTRNTHGAKSAQGKNLSYEDLLKVYNIETRNNLVTYKRSRDRIEGFYFLSSSKHSDIVSYYISRLEAFEHFTQLVSLWACQMQDRRMQHSGYCQNSTCNNLYQTDEDVKLLGQRALAELFPSELS